MKITTVPINNLGTNDTFVLTPSGLLTFLAEVEELSEFEINLSSTDNGIAVSIGDSIYDLQYDSEIIVEDQVVDEIEDIDSEGYDELKDEYGESFKNLEEVEGGIIKELAKTLLVGGLVRLTKDAILKS